MILLLFTSLFGATLLTFIVLWRRGELDMDETPKEEMMEESSPGIEHYGDSGITSGDARIPRWLRLTYWFLPFWGIATFYLFWNGASGWLDRGSWKQLEEAAQTTYPHKQS